MFLHLVLGVRQPAVSVSVVVAVLAAVVEETQDSVLRHHLTPASTVLLVCHLFIYLFIQGGAE